MSTKISYFFIFFYFSVNKFKILFYLHWNEFVKLYESFRRKLGRRFSTGFEYDCGLTYIYEIPLKYHIRLRPDIVIHRDDNDFEIFHSLPTFFLKNLRISCKIWKIFENCRISENPNEIHFKYHMRLRTNLVRCRDDVDFEIGGRILRLFWRPLNGKKIIQKPSQISPQFRQGFLQGFSEKHVNPARNSNTHSKSCKS